MTDISSRTRFVFVIGDPIEHSLSPVFQNAALRKEGIDAVYLAARVEPGNLEHAVRGLSNLGCIGLNVTMPHKVPIVGFMDELDETAKSAGAVNTVKNFGGKLVGYNTDCAGVEEALLRAGLRENGKKAVVLGAGGAARAACVALSRFAREITIVNRTHETAVELAEKLMGRGIRAEAVRWDELPKALEGSSLLVNTTSRGMHPAIDDSPVPLECLRPEMAVLDLIYYPWRTKLMRDAERIGSKTITGLDVLVFQGAESFRIWFEREPDVGLMMSSATEAARARERV